MPTRMLRDGLLTSPSLAWTSPRAQDAFPRFLLLADDFGCFDANPRVLVGRGWPLRPDVTEADIAAWLDEYVQVGMLQIWDDNGHRYGFLTGWTGPNGQTARDEYDRKKFPHGSKRKTPKPPPPAESPSGSPAGKPSFPVNSPTAVSVSVAVADGVSLKEATAPRPQPASRHKRLVEKLVAAFEDVKGKPYKFQQAKDGDAVKALLAYGDDEEILSRWRRGLLLGSKWPGVATIAQLRGKWNELAAADTPRQAPRIPDAQPPKTLDERSYDRWLIGRYPDGPAAAGVSFDQARAEFQRSTEGGNP